MAWFALGFFTGGLLGSAVTSALAFRYLAQEVAAGRADEDYRLTEARRCRRQATSWFETYTSASEYLDRAEKLEAQVFQEEKKP